MPQIIVLIGPQGAGKGTQARFLAERLSMSIIATGEILRRVARSGTELGKRVAELQSSGQLVPDDVLAEIIGREVASDEGNGYILDGFPRNLAQAELLEQIASEKGIPIKVANIMVPRQLLWKRLAGRRTCPKCETAYNIYLKPSKTEGVCDLDGTPLITRQDDNEEAIAMRLALYDAKTSPLLDYYRQTGRVHDVDGEGDPDQVFSRLLAAVTEAPDPIVGEGQGHPMTEQAG